MKHERNRVSPKANIAGALALISAIALAVGALARLVPAAAPAGAVARMFDSLAPGLLALAFLFALLSLACGLRRFGLGLALAAVFAAALLVRDHARLSLPLTPDRGADLRLLFFNALADNTAHGDRIVSAILAENPDIVVIAEAEAIHPALDRLQAVYGFVSPCDSGSCGLLVATRLPLLRFWRLSLNPAWENRYAVAELETGTGKRFFLAAVHLMKPWFTGLSEVELAQLAAQYDWLAGPAVAVGDFNMAPWSLPMRRLLAHTGFRAPRRPVPTWPAGLGALGVPIDHVLVHDGPRVVAIAPFGAALSSNHRGLVADIALP